MYSRCATPAAAKSLADAHGAHLAPCSAGDPAAAVATLEAADAPTTRTYTYAIDAVARSGDLNGAMQLYGRMLKARLVPDKFTLTVRDARRPTPWREPLRTTRAISGSGAGVRLSPNTGGRRECRSAPWRSRASRHCDRQDSRRGVLATDAVFVSFARTHGMPVADHCARVFAWWTTGTRGRDTRQVPCDAHDGGVHPSSSARSPRRWQPTQDNHQRADGQRTPGAWT